MTDIVERLRSAAKWGTMTSEFDASDRIEWMAADEIERLRHDLARAVENHTADLARLAEAERDAARWRTWKEYGGLLDRELAKWNPARMTYMDWIDVCIDRIAADPSAAQQRDAFLWRDKP